MDVDDGKIVDLEERVQSTTILSGHSMQQLGKLDRRVAGQRVEAVVALLKKCVTCLALIQNIVLVVEDALGLSPYDMKDQLPAVCGTVIVFTQQLWRALLCCRLGLPSCDELVLTAPSFDSRLLQLRWLRGAGRPRVGNILSQRLKERAASLSWGVREVVVGFDVIAKQLEMVADDVRRAALQWIRNAHNYVLDDSGLTLSDWIQKTHCSTVEAYVLDNPQRPVDEVILLAICEALNVRIACIVAVDRPLGWLQVIHPTGSVPSPVLWIAQDVDGTYRSLHKPTLQRLNPRSCRKVKKMIDWYKDASSDYRGKFLEQWYKLRHLWLYEQNGQTTILHEVASHGDAFMLGLVLVHRSYGECCLALNQDDEHGKSPFYLAIQCGCLDVIEHICCMYRGLFHVLRFNPLEVALSSRQQHRRDTLLILLQALQQPSPMSSSGGTMPFYTRPLPNSIFLRNGASSTRDEFVAWLLQWSRDRQPNASLSSVLTEWDASPTQHWQLLRFALATLALVTCRDLECACLLLRVGADPSVLEGVDLSDDMAHIVFRYSLGNVRKHHAGFLRMQDEIFEVFRGERAPTQEINIICMHSVPWLHSMYQEACRSSKSLYFNASELCWSGTRYPIPCFCEISLPATRVLVNGKYPRFFKRSRLVLDICDESKDQTTGISWSVRDERATHEKIFQPSLSLLSTRPCHAIHWLLLREQQIEQRPPKVYCHMPLVMDLPMVTAKHHPLMVKLGRIPEGLLSRLGSRPSNLKQHVYVLGPNVIKTFSVQAGKRYTVTSQLNSTAHKLSRHMRLVAVSEKIKDCPQLVQITQIRYSNAGDVQVVSERWGLKLESCMLQLDARQIARVLADVVTGLRALHALDLVHGDLSPGNIVVGYSGLNVYAKLCDYDSLSPGSGEQQSILGTPDWSSPERQSGHCEPADDVFSLGKLLAFLKGKFVSPHKEVLEELAALCTGKSNTRPKLEDIASKLMPVIQTVLSAGGNCGMRPVDPTTRSQDYLANQEPLEQRPILLLVTEMLAREPRCVPVIVHIVGRRSSGATFTLPWTNDADTQKEEILQLIQVQSALLFWDEACLVPVTSVVHAWGKVWLMEPQDQPLQPLPRGGDDAPPLSLPRKRPSPLGDQTFLPSHGVGIRLRHHGLLPKLIAPEDVSMRALQQAVGQQDGHFVSRYDDDEVQISSEQDLRGLLHAVGVKQMHNTGTLLELTYVPSSSLTPVKSDGVNKLLNNDGL